jgi:DNA-binding transcriptional ArsR family regulator
MLKSMLQYQSLDRVFHALADPTRRAMIERLAAGPASVSALAEPFAVSLSAIGQHVHLLESSGLVRTRKIGRVRTVELVPDALTTAERWFTRHRARWEDRFDRLGALLAESDEKPKPRRRKP